MQTVLSGCTSLAPVFLLLNPETFPQDTLGFVQSASLLFKLPLYLLQKKHSKSICFLYHYQLLQSPSNNFYLFTLSFISSSSPSPTLYFPPYLTYFSSFSKTLLHSLFLKVPTSLPNSSMMLPLLSFLSATSTGLLKLESPEIAEAVAKC